MNQIWQSIQSEVAAALVALVPVAGMALRAWLKNRTRRWNEAGLEAWRQAEERAPLAADSLLESLAVSVLSEQGFSAKQAVEVARRTKPLHPLPLSGRRAIVPPAPESEGTPSAERRTVPSPGVKPPTG